MTALGRALERVSTTLALLAGLDRSLLYWYSRLHRRWDANGVFNWECRSVPLILMSSARWAIHFIFFRWTQANGFILSSWLVNFLYARRLRQTRALLNVGERLAAKNAIIRLDGSKCVKWNFLKFRSKRWLLFFWFTVTASRFMKAHVETAKEWKLRISRVAALLNRSLVDTIINLLHEDVNVLTRSHVVQETGLLIVPLQVVHLNL